MFAPWLLALLVALVAAQIVAPVGNPGLAPSNNGSEPLRLFIDSPRGIVDLGPIEALTAQASLDSPDAIKITGLLVLTNPQGAVSVDALTSSDIALVSCEGSKASDQFKNAASRSPAAIVLYSIEGAAELARCAYTPPADNGPPYSMVYTMTSRDRSGKLADLLKPNPSAIQALIAQRADVVSTTSNPPEAASQVPNGGSRSPGVMGPSPTTAVAMIVLYSITGVITALFLIIIITGAIRAHRHPERYGPRAAGHGRSRQSRAKGIARAMLDTLPIVKFGEKNETAKSGADLELGTDGGQAPNTEGAPVTRKREEGESIPADQVRDVAQNTDTTLASVAGAADSAPAGADEIGPTAPDQDATEEGQLGCSICTEDFVKGEDVRVLPCNHKYHPACVDPWLLNVSGTCPLCRIDLRPAATAQEQLDGGDGLNRNADPTALMAGHHGGNDSRLRISRFLELHLGLSPHDGPHERIAALRRFRDNNNNGSRSSSRRGSRLSGIFRESFRRQSTRMEQVEPESSNAAQPSTQASATPHT